MELLLLGLLVAAAALRLRILHRDMERLGTELELRLKEDTNVGLDVPAGDRYFRRLVQILDRQLRQLRREHLRYAQGDRELKAAVTGISHDLRTPLTAICGYLELLKREDMTSEVRSYLEVISGRVEAMRSLTEELLRYSVVLSPGTYEERETVNLCDALAESIAAFYGAFRSKGITPEIILPESPVLRRLNRQALGRIFSNMISNVLRYSAGNFVVTLTDAGKITFQNRAVGLSEVQVGHFFDRFFTVSSGENAGTGLGMSIAKTLTEYMGGSIHAELQGEMFTVTVAFD